MKKYHSPKSLEEILAEKANSFSMRPSKDLWQGIDAGLQKSARMARIRLYSLLGFLLILFSSVFYFNVFNTRTVTQTLTPDLNIPGNSLEPGQPNRGGHEQENATAPNSALPAKYEEFKLNQEKVYTSLPSFHNPIELSNNNLSDEAEAVSLVHEINGESIENMDLGIKLQAQKPLQINKLRNKQYINPHQRGWSVQVNYVPALAGRNMISRTPYSESHIKIKDKADGMTVGQSFRILSRYHFGEKLSVSFGLAYMQMGETIGLAPSTANNQQIGLAQSYGYKLSELRSIGNQEKFRNQYHFVQVPLAVYVSQPINTRLNIQLGMGLSVGYLFSKEAMVFDHRINHYAYSNNFYRNWGFGTHLQTLIGYQLNTRTQLITGPEFHYELLSTYKNYYPVNQHQYNLGWNFGVHIKMGSIPFRGGF